MKERPILFSAPMVKAILDGQKTMTRRVNSIGEYYISDKKCPYGVVGDRLWVRETWKLVPETAYHLSEGVLQTINPSDPHEAAIYKCGWERSPGGVPWKPSIFMPRWASRITLEITDIKVERLQDITEEDAMKEGIPMEIDCPECDTARKKFKNLWDSINGRGKKPGKTWQDNPWVWVIEFKRINNE